MGTQWVARSKEAGRDDFGSRSAYRPRHAKRKGHHPRTPYPVDHMPALAAGQGSAGQFEPPGPGADASAPASLGQTVRDRAGPFARDRSRRYGDGQWSQPGSA
jgi:hypothetical protein